MITTLSTTEKLRSNSGQSDNWEQTFRNHFQKLKYPFRMCAAILHSPGQRLPIPHIPVASRNRLVDRRDALKQRVQPQKWNAIIPPQASTIIRLPLTLNFPWCPLTNHMGSALSRKAFGNSVTFCLPQIPSSLDCKLDGHMYRLQHSAIGEHTPVVAYHAKWLLPLRSTSISLSSGSFSCSSRPAIVTH